MREMRPCATNVMSTTARAAALPAATSFKSLDGLSPNPEAKRVPPTTVISAPTVLTSQSSVHAAPSVVGASRRDNDHAVRTARTIDGRSPRVLKDYDRLDVSRVEFGGTLSRERA